MLLALLPRFVARRAFACFAALLVATVLPAQGPSAADGFDPNVDGNVYVLAMQPDGKLIVGGQFGHFRSREGFAIGRNNLARLNADGSLDDTFNPGPNGPVRAVVVQPDGGIVVAGDFTGFQPEGGAAVERSRIARLSASGTVDPSFNYTIQGQALPGGATLASQVFALALQPDGALVVGGSFASVTPGNLTVTYARRNLFRIAANGAIDASYDPNPNGMVLALVAHVDNKIVVGGGFTTFKEAQRTSETIRNRLARLNPDGTLDTEFDPNANNGVTALAVQRDGKLIVGGHFTTLQPFGSDSATRNHAARLNVDGTLDSEFFPNTNGSVYEVAVQPDGAILIGGAFNTAWGRGSGSTLRGNAARFLTDGTLDPDFNPNFNAQVDAFAFPSDGKLIVGGYFTRAQPPGSVTSIVRNRLARLNASGSLDADFEVSAGGRILVTAVQADGKLIVGGSFTNIGGETHNYLARLNPDGSVDSSYKPDFNGQVYALAMQPDGKVIVGGAFTTIGGEPRSRIARLNPSGTIDSEFHPNLNGNVAALILQPDGKILVGGGFTAAQPIGATEPVARTYLLRLNANGTLDTAFNPGPNADISFLALLPDGKIVATGLFSSFTPNAGTTTTGRNFIARLNADGTVDTAYDPNPNGRITSLALLPDGKLIIAGVFDAFLPNNALTIVERVRMARINVDGTIDAAYVPTPTANVMTMALQPDGKLLIGGDFLSIQQGTDANLTFRRYAARLNADGTVDPAFDLDINQQPGNRVDSIRRLDDGRLLVGGVFTSLQPIGTPTRLARRNFVRINADGTLDEAFEPGAGGTAGGQINAFALQADNKVVAVGSFTDLGGAKTTNIARFNPEGTADASFGTATATSGPIHAVVIRPTGTTVPASATGFAWLNRDGTLRTSFAASGNARLSGEVYSTLVQADGSIIVAGAFANLTNATGGNLARFSPAGVLDTSFNPNPNGAVTALAQDSDGRIVIVGSFTMVHGAARNRIARLNADGSLDPVFDPNANGRISAVGLAPDGKIVIGGAFTSVLPNATSTSTPRNYLARLNSDGTVDTNYNPNLSGPVNALVVQGDGKVIVGGAFAFVQPNTATTASIRNNVARFNVDGTLDEGFNPNAAGTVGTIALQPNGQILLGGAFTAFQPYGTGPVHTRNNLARFHSDGAIDTDYNPNPNGAVSTLAVQPDGALLIGGSFTTVQPNAVGAPVTRNHLARLGPDGSLDLAFNPDVDGEVFHVAARPDGSIFVGGSFGAVQAGGLIVVGGDFASIGGIPARNLAALSDNGSVNSAFQPNPNGAVHALLALPDGRLLAGGAFTSVAGATRSRLARFNADGTLDAGFNPAFNGTVYALALQADGKVLAAGAGTGPSIIRLNTDGGVDPAFNGPATGTSSLGVRALVVQADGRILYVVEGSGIRHTLARLNADGTADGTFAPVQAAAGAFNSLALQADGRVLVGGDFTLGSPGISRLARLNRDGSLDAGYNPGVNGTVTALALQSDGRPVVGGNFTRVGSVNRTGLARLATTDAATQMIGIQPDRRTVVWARGGTAGEIAAAVFEQSTDGVTWATLGFGTRIAGTANWQLGGLTLPASGVFYLRARGIAPTHGVSSGLHQSVREFNFSSPLSAPASVIASSGAPSGSGSSTVIYAFDFFSGVFTTAVGGGSGNPDGSPFGGSRLADIATQARVSAATPLLAGFTVGGSGTRNILVRAVGPGLTSFGVNGVLAAPQLRLYDRAGQLLATNDGWADSPALSAAFAQAGAFPLPAGSADAAALIALPPGSYTIQVADGSGAGGVALAEVYDVGHITQPTDSARLINLSTRATLNVGGNVVIGGFVVTGAQEKRLLVRGVGPSLAQFDVPGVSADPAITIYNSAGIPIASNDDWSAASVGVAADGPAPGAAAAVAAAAASVGAFPLDVGSKDAALVITLPPGAYTVHIGDQAGVSGAALIELYELP